MRRPDGDVDASTTTKSNISVLTKTSAGREGRQGYRQRARAAQPAVALHLRLTWFEDPWLARRHGEAWQACRSRVRRWL